MKENNNNTHQIKGTKTHMNLKLFILTAMLSSYLIYVVRNVIEATVLDELS